MSRGVYPGALGAPDALALTLHHFDLLPQGHPEPSGWRVSQEFPGVLVAWHIWYTVLRLRLIFLERETAGKQYGQRAPSPPRLPQNAARPGFLSGELPRSSGVTSQGQETQ